MSKLKAKQTFDPDRGPIFSVRFLIAVVLMLAGLAWVVYTGFVVVFPDNPDGAKAKGIQWAQDHGNWNYLIGFGLLFLGMIIAAHPTTPLGRGRGVVVGMLTCFLGGLAWICVYYAIANMDVTKQPAIFDDLQQKNLFVGIAMMAVGFTFATRWE